MKHTIRNIMKAGAGAILAAGLISGILTSCEIGLGASVDTNRPTVEITYPPRNSVIRDGFILAGKAGDDRGLAKVVITATNGSTGSKFTREVSLAGLNEDWSIELNAPGTDGKYEMTDGKYTVDAEAYDLDGKSSGAASITVEIDNTAPFFIANKPGSSKWKNPSPYGSNMTVTGVVAEDHDVSVMEMKVYALNDDGSLGEELSKETGFTEENVQTAGGVSVKFADNNADSGKLLDRYRKMYTKGTGTESFCAKFILTDSAKTYKNPKETENSTTGNSTDTFYLTDDLTPLTAASGLGMNAAEIKAVVNGTSSESPSKQTAVIERLTSKARKDAYFSLNPANNPTYNIGSSSYADSSLEDGITATANKGITLSVQFSAGRDEVNLVPSSLRLYLVGPVGPGEYSADYGAEIFASEKWLDVSKEEANDGGETYTKYTYTKKTPSGNTKFTDISKVTELQNKKASYWLDSSDTGLNYEYGLDAEITAGNYYFLVAVGEDKDGNQIKCAEGYYYGFKAQSSGTPPTVEIGEKENAWTNPLNSGITNSKKIVFKGTASIDGATIDKVMYSVSLKKGSDAATVTEYEATGYEKTSATDWTIEYEPKKADDSLLLEDGNVYTAEFTIWAVDSGSRRSSDVFRSVTIDLTKPEISISSVTPEVTYGGKKCVNGTVKASINAADETKFKEWTWKAYAGSETDENLIGKGTSSNTAGNFTFDTAAKAAYNGKDLILKLAARDEAGNETTVNETSYFIDQNSDKPVIDVSASVDPALTEAEVGEGKNLFTISGSSAGSISATVTDDDGVSEITAEYSMKNGSSWGGWKEFYSVKNLTADTITKSVILAKDGSALEPGIYKIRITAKDKVTGTAGGAYGTGTTGEFYIGITRGKPTLKVANQSGLWHKAGETVEISGSGDTTITKVERKYAVGKENLGSASWEEVTWTAGNFTDSITIPEATKKGTVYVCYRGTDSYGQTGDEVEFTYNIDGNAPTFDKSGVTWDDGSAISGSTYENRNTVKVSAEAKDGSGESGVEAVSFIITDSASLSDEEKNASALWTVVSGGERSSPVEEGTHYVHVRAADKAGNVTYKAGVKFMSDTSKPVVSITEPVYYQDGSADLTVTGTASDSVGLSASEAVKVYVNGELKKTYTAADVKSGITYTLAKADIQALTEGESEITFTALDLSEKTESQSVKIRYDVTGPVLTVTSPDSFDSWISSAKTSISGTADDASKISAVYWSKNGSAAVPAKASALTESAWTGNGWKKATGTTAWKITDFALSEGNNTLVLSAVDEYGNITAKETKTLKSDQAKPEVSLTACKVNGTAQDISSAETIIKSGSFVLEGSFSDSASKVTLSSTKGTVSYTSGKSGDWSISETGLADGTYTYEITATDESGRIATVSRTVMVDTTAPVYKAMKVGNYDYQANKWSKDASFTLSGTWTEEGSGIAKLEYWSLTSDAEPAAAADGTITPAKSAEGWTFRQNFNFADGVNYFCVRPTDNAGNVGAYTYFNLNVDTKAPDLVIYNGTGKDDDDNTIDILDSIIYRKPSETITVSGTLEDTISYINAWYAIRIFAGDYDVNYADWDSINKKVTEPAGQVALIGSLHDCTAKGCSHTEAQKQNLQEKSGSFSVDINAADLPKDSSGKLLSQYVITVVGEDYKENRTVKSFTVNIDGTAPSIEVNSLTKLIDDGAKTNNVNGTVTVQGVTTDNDKVESFTLALYNKDTDPTYTSDLSGSAVKAANDSSASKWKYEIDTTKLADKKTYVLVMKATDRTGNEGSIEEEIYVNQATDLPSYSSSNAELKQAGDTTAALITARAKKNLFGMGNTKINGTVSDDDGVKTISWTITGKKTDGTAYSKTDSKAGSGKTSEDFSVTVPSDLNGEASLSVTVTDITAAAKSATFTVPFVFDDSAPSIVPHQVNGGTYSENMFVKGTFNIDFAASDTNGIAKVIEINKGTKAQIGTALTETSSGSGIWRQSVTENSNLDDPKTRTYQVTDTYGRTAETSISYKVDVSSPVLTAANFRVSGGDSGDKTESQLADFWFRSESVTVKNADGKAIVTDANLKSNVSYAVTGDTTDSGSFDMTVTGTNGTMNNNRAVSNGTSVITYTFSDKAGNSVEKSFTVKVDNKAPVVSGLSLKAGAATLSAGTVTNASAITAGFTVQDVTSGLKEAYIALKSGFDQTNSSEYLTKMTLSGTASTAKTYSIATSSMEEGSYEVWLRVLDAAGNSTGDTRIGSFVLDNQPPVVSFGTVFDADATKAGNQVNKTISITGTVSDSHLAATVLPKFYVDSNTTDQIGQSTYAESGKTVKASRSGNGWTVSGIDTTKLTAGNHTFKVTFTDSAGNTTSTGNTVTVDVDQNTDRPVITLNTINHDGSTTLNNGGLAGSVSDDDGAVNKFEIAVTGGTAPQDADWTEKTLDGSSWSHTVTQLSNRDTLDGAYRVWFRVKDNAGTTFTTVLYDDGATDAAKASADLGMPEFTYQGNVRTSGEPVAFSIDQNAPVFGQIKVQVWDGSKYGDAEEFKSNVYYGGKDKPKVKFTIPVTDTITAPADLTVSVQLGEADAIPLTYDNGYTYELDFSTVSSGLLLISFSAADKSGYPAKKTYNITVDNGEPLAVSNVTPNATTEMTSTVTMNGTVNDESDGNSGVREMAYVIPKYKTGTKPSDPENLPSGSAWITEGAENVSKLTRNSISWSIDFTDLDDGQSEINDNYSGYLVSDGIYQLPVWFRITDNMGNVKYDTANSIRYNPNADRPTVTVTYPENKTELKDAGGNLIKKYDIMGGTIRITGTANDNEGVEGVYLQYDINGDGLFNDTDRTWLSGNGYTVVTVPGTDPAQWGVKASGTISWQAQFNSTTLVNSDGYENNPLEIGNGKNTANRTLNIRVCAVDSDTVNGQLVSSWSDQLHVSVNNSVPQFSDPFKLVQYSDSTYTTKIFEEDYSKDIYIRGNNWRLEGSVIDDNGIEKITLSEDIRAEYETQYGSDGMPSSFEQKKGTAFSCLTAITGGYDIKIPFNTDKASLKLTIEASDHDTTGVSKSSITQMSLYIDNTAPAFCDGENDDTLVLYRDSYGETGNILSESSEELRNYSGWTTIAGKTRETGSGFKRVVFYAERYSGTQSSKSNRRIYNVMEAHTADGKERTANRTDLAASEALNSVYINSDGLPVLKVTADERTAEDKLTVSLTGIGDNKNIRKGGLVYLGGDYRLIKSYTKVSADQITVGIDSNVATDKTTAYFVYGMVIDNSGESRNTDGSVKNDDGDGMVESYAKSGTDTTWDASFDSSNIPDGPVEMHVVVFDNAGNSRHGSVVTRVSNNALRIARVKLGTDLNGDGSISDSELTYFHARINNGVADELTKTENGKTVANMDAGEEVWNLDSAVENGGEKWKIKSGLTVKPEFVGGTGDIFYVFSKAVGTGEGTHLKAAATASGLGSLDVNNVANGKVKEGAIELPDTVLNPATDENGVINTATGENGVINTATGENGVNTYRFSFWDSTEESVPGSTSGSCVLNAELYQDLVDETRPVPYIHPFFWKGSGAGSSSVPNNSLQWTAASEDTAAEALGHIELESDWTPRKADGSAVGKDETAATTGVYDADPKVSGKIVIRGSVYDETRLTQVKIVSSDSKIIGSAAGLTSTYTASSGTWSTASGTGYTFTVTDAKVGGAASAGPTQKGHLVEWRLELDTEKVTNVAKADVTFTVTGKDGSDYCTADTEQTVFGASKYYATSGQAENGNFFASKEASVAGTDPVTSVLDKLPFMTGYAAGSDTIGEYSTGTYGYYRMDVVPYVTDVVTELSAKDGNTKGKYSRSALGHYPVRSVVSNNNNKNNDPTSETVTMKGFNLYADGATVAVTGFQTTTPGTAATASAKSQLSFSAASLKTRAITATVNGIPLMNNINNNDAKGQCTGTGTAYANCYNRQPNGDNNNNLTDDIYFDVWEFNDRVAKPVGKSIGGTVMKVNSFNNLIQYAFSDGVHFRMGIRTSETNSSSQNVNYAYDTFAEPSIGFHVDADGYTVAAAHSSDTNDGNRIDFTRFATSRWGIGKDEKYDMTDNMIVLEGTGDSKDRMERQRIWSTSFASTSGKMYMSYYDLLTKQIRFRAGNIGNSAGAFGMFNNDKDGTTNADNVQVVANATTTGLASAANKRGSGKFVSIAASQYTDSSSNTKDAVSMVWFDSINGALRYSYIEDPIGKLTTSGSITGITGNKTAANWSTPETIGISGGQYCQIAAAEDGTIHIAAYGDDGYLYYAYASDYKGGFTAVCVDATDDVGQNLTLDVALKNVSTTATANYKAIPYIGYLSSAGYPKYAYLTDAAARGDTGTSKAGVTNYRFTGNWESTIVPTGNALFINQEDHINVGVWKTTAAASGVPKGTLKNSYSTSTDVGESSVGTNSSTTYGNGTANGVLVYQVVDKTATYTDVLESAQLRAAN